MMKHVFWISFLAIFVVPLSAMAQGDPAAFADAYDRCMKQKPKYATKCYRHTCFYQGCVAQYSSRIVGGAVAVTDPALMQSATANCTPHIQALKLCNEQHGIINVPAKTEPDKPNKPAATRLSCKAKDNEEGGCCCFKGAHTYRFEPRTVGTATVTFDTGRKFNCKSTVAIDALIGADWVRLSAVEANSSSGGSEVAPRTVKVVVNQLISGLRVGDGCVCCTDNSSVMLV